MNNLITGDSTIAMMQAAQQQSRTQAEMMQNAGKIRNYGEIEQAAKEFEAVFLSEMLKPMFEGLEPDPMFGGGHGEKVFQGMMIQEYGKTMAEQGGIGLAEHVKTELIKLQEALDNGNR